MTDAELIGSRMLFNKHYEEFYGAYSKGMNAYLAGKWKIAKEIFTKTATMFRVDKNMGK